MKKLALLIVVIVASVATAWAQSSPVTVTNTTNCAYLVRLVATEDGCGAQCPSAVVCVLPGSSVVINPCNPNWFWDRAVVVPTIDACQPCGSLPVRVNSPAPTNCLGLSNPMSGVHCAGCGFFTVDFATLTTLNIF